MAHHPASRVISKAPTRIDLAGGTLDLWPIHHLLPKKATVNFGITLDAEVTCSFQDTFCLISHDQSISQTGSLEEIINKPLLPIISILLEAFWSQKNPPLRIETKALSPAGAGLGGSSCLGIALAGALNHLRHQLGDHQLLDHQQLVRLVQDAESRLIKAPTGVQDYWGAVRGNINIIEFPFGSVQVETVSNNLIDQLNQWLIVVYSGQSRASAINNWEIFKKLYDGDKDLLGKFVEIGALAFACGDAIKRQSLQEAFFFSQKEWELRQTLWPLIETAVTKKIDLAAKKSGALFTRVCGAGGGGVMGIFAPPDHHHAVKRAVQEAGGTILDARVAPYGLTVAQD
jgi:D-glycero-alpha-D-manno-heptose-7-phosphate kinase